MDRRPKNTVKKRLSAKSQQLWPVSTCTAFIIMQAGRTQVSTELWALKHASSTLGPWLLTRRKVLAQQTVHLGGWKHAQIM